jgi:hypothetical protein
MDWGYLELPTELEKVARFTPVVWDKTAVERHRKKDKSRIRVGIVYLLMRLSFAFQHKTNPSEDQKMAFLVNFGLKNSFSDRYPNCLVYEKLFFILGLISINSAHALPFPPTYLYRGGYFADPSLVSKQGHCLPRGNHHFL